jgi:hypothetical protein
MKKYYKYKLIKEQDETNDGDNSLERASYDIAITPINASIEDAIKALENIENYGPYIPNLRNAAVDVNKAVEDYFGPSQRFEKLKKEKERGKPFPTKTKQAVDDFIKSLKSKPTLLSWKISEDFLIFPSKRNPSKKVTQNIINTVMSNVGIKYDLTEKESLIEIKIIETIKNIIHKKYGR